MENNIRTNMVGICLIIIASFFTISCMAQKTDNTPVGEFNLQRYLGNWYEIARMNHSFEKGISHAQANYTLQGDGSILVVNSGIKKGKVKVSQGKAKLTDTVGVLRVSFFGPFYSDYRVLMVDPDYQYALVGSRKDKYLWILSRTPVLSDTVLCEILREAGDRGYRTDGLIWVEHDPIDL